jgi:hypothetical protein
VAKNFRKFVRRAEAILAHRRLSRNTAQRFTLKSPGSDRSGRERSLKSIYRISDGGYQKERFPFATKDVCLRNFLSVFRPDGDDLIVIADNVGSATWDMVNALHPNVIRTEIGHGAGSWRYAVFDIALERFANDDVVYLVEDDYLHLPDSRQALIEGIAVADYVSLYDHLDKYENAAEGGPNHFVAFGGELTRVIRTPSTHWKVTNSTTMTFATTVEVLREDRDLWDKYTKERHPHDLQAFLALAERGRSLITPVPGYSTHCEPRWASPGVDWERVAQQALG